MKHVDLCSGIGGFALGFEWAGLSTPVLFCDIEEWCRNILQQHWSNVPVKSDVKELANDPERLVPDCDIITAGYPCQPFSQAGKRQGEEDSRHVWPYIRKIVASKRPSWVVFENVYGHISLGLDTVLTDLATEGYTTRTFVVPAVAIGAPHRRHRVWIVGYATDDGCDGGSEATGRAGAQSEQDESRPEVRGELGGPGSDVADADDQRPQGWVSGRQDTERQGVNGHAGCSSAIHRQPNQEWWTTEPDVGRVAHGVSGRVDRIKGLGNAIVPQIAQQIAESIKVVENAKKC